MEKKEQYALIAIVAIVAIIAIVVLVINVNRTSTGVAYISSLEGEQVESLPSIDSRSGINVPNLAGDLLDTDCSTSQTCIDCPQGCSCGWSEDYKMCACHCIVTP